MKKTRLLLLAATWAVSFIFGSCKLEILLETGSASEDSGTSRINLRLTHDEDTRSSIAPDEGHIEDICIMAYSLKDGKLADMQTRKSADEIEMELTCGEYDIYVTSNMGTFDAPVNESDMAEAFHDISSFSSIGKALPMKWKGKAVLKAGENTTIYAELSRLVSKVEFNVEMGILNGLEITSVRLCQAAGRIWPFMEGGSRILAPEEATDGDYATPEDIESLMAGESICFYVPENCQGMLLPDNDDPWKKVPDSIGDMAELCTYIEMTGQWTDGADYEGQVKYRFYLGEDNSRSFDVRGNSIHNLTLYLKEESFDNISWKIDASGMESVAWEAYSTLDENFHDKDNFYVTERICVNFSFDAIGQKYWAKKDNAFSLAGIGYDGELLIRFDEVTNLGKGKFQAIGTCISPGSYDIVLLDSETGRIRYVMEHGTVHVPEAIAGEDGMFADKPVVGLMNYSRHVINGESSDICIYLTDKDGYNLNQGHYYGCDFSICRWDTEIFNTVYGHDLFEGAAVEIIPGDTGSDSYAVCYRLSFDNDGKDKEWNKVLTESLGGDILRLRFTDTTSGASGEHPMAVYADEAKITFKTTPADIKAVLGTEFMYEVENPSNIPLAIRGIKLNSMSIIPGQAKASSILCKKIPGHIGTDPLLISRMPYTACSMEEDSAPSAVVDGKRCYPAYDDGTEQSDIPYQLAMFHAFEVLYLHTGEAWASGLSGDIGIEGMDQYLNCGAVMHHNSYSIELFDPDNGTETDFQDYGNILTTEYIRKFNDLIEVAFSINENNEITAVASDEVTVDLSITGNIKGHIRCISVQDPFSTIWGHYFTHNQEFSFTKTIRIGKEPTLISGTLINDAFAGMRQLEYYSVLDAWKVEDFRTPWSMGWSVREYLKPESISLVVKAGTPTDIPLAVSLTGRVTYDYKTSDPVNWPTGFGYKSIVPSTYDGFDSGVDDDGCPPASVFKEELLILEPKTMFNLNQGLYFIPQP